MRKNLEKYIKDNDLKWEFRTYEYWNNQIHIILDGGEQISTVESKFIGDGAQKLVDKPVKDIINEVQWKKELIKLGESFKSYLKENNVNTNKDEDVWECVDEFRKYINENNLSKYVLSEMNGLDIAFRATRY